MEDLHITIHELQDHINNLTSENERLREANYKIRARLAILTGAAVENVVLDALQPKEGGQ